ncbi:F0F1 ATP synthase subunit B [Spiroplasma endosymbiont of Anurida maritima]|uniref:F0F1 ATP synthase subunit B n=1 Tax=Spiroplasma endosymbiont of Anurida maritima TaxID=2967972 RepID=UPI0036D31EBE
MLMLLNKGVESSEIINQLFPNLWMFISHIIATVILLLLLAKLVYRPFRKSMHDRREYIRSLIESAVEKQATANINEKKSKDKIVDAKSQASQIVLDAQSKALKTEEEILKEAKNKYQQMLDDAKFNIEKEQKQLETKIKQEIVDVAFSTAEKILEKEISADKHKKLIDESINEI